MAAKTKKKLLTGGQIERRRHEHNLTQKELSALVVKETNGEVKCKSSYLSFIEGGFRPKDNMRVIEVLTEILNREPSDEAKQAVADKKARAKARATAARRKAAKKKS